MELKTNLVCDWNLFTSTSFNMDYIWSVPAVDNAQSSQDYQAQPAPSLQYPVFDPYFMWQQPWMTTGSYAPMYTYGMPHLPGYDPHVPLPCKEVNKAPISKRALIQEGPPIAKRSRRDSEVELPNLRDITSTLSTTNDSNKTGQGYQFADPRSPVAVKADTLTSSGSIISDPTFQERLIAIPQLEGSQVTVMLPDGSKSSLWDQQVPAAFAAYHQPTAYAVVPGPARKRRRRSGPKAKPHTDERPHVCQVCGKGFVSAQNLKQHHRVHTKEKLFSCTRCDRRFGQSRDRLIHMVTEACIRAERYIRRTGKGWECTSCWDIGPFESRDQAERHARGHETGKGLKCPVCPTNFQGLKANYLLKHIQECHPGYIATLGL